MLGEIHLFYSLQEIKHGLLQKNRKPEDKYSYCNYNENSLPGIWAIIVSKVCVGFKWGYLRLEYLGSFVVNWV